jgi:quercetin dioxygenase-like cupin family protein
MGPTMPKDVTDVVRSVTDLSKEPAGIKGRQFRLRQLDMKPGAIVPWHSHDNRPAMIYIVSGEVVEYASNCAVPIVHKAGDVASERNGTSHWWQNTGSTTAVLISVDLFPVEGQDGRSHDVTAAPVAPLSRATSSGCAGRRLAPSPKHWISHERLQ